MLCGLFEGAQYNSVTGAKCAVYSRARTKPGRGVIKEIRYVPSGKDIWIGQATYTKDLLLKWKTANQLALQLM